MNKLTKLLSVFILAGAVGASVAGVAGCTKNDDDSGNGHTHSYEYTQISGNAEKHNVHCKNEGHEGGDTQENHEWENGECKKCHYAQPGESVVAPEGATGIMTEWQGGLEDVELSETTKSTSIDLTKLKVYFKIGSEKSTEVPSANYDVTVSKDGDPITMLTELKQGHYEVAIELVGVKNTAGTPVNWEAFDEINVTNPVKDGSLVKTSTGDVTIDQGAEDTISSKWTFEVTLANGDKQSVEPDSISPLETLSTGEKEATVTFGTQTIKVNYTVVAVEGMVTQSYAVNANTLAAGSNTSNLVLNEAGKISLTAKSGKNVDIDGSVKETDGKSFVQRIKLGGSPIKNGSLDGTTVFRTIKLEDVNKTTVEGATSKTLVTVYAVSSSEGTPRNLSIYKEGGTAEAPTLTKVEGLTHAFGTIDKYVYEINDTGTFHIASESGGINICYIQVDKIMKGETGATNVELGGEMKAISLKVNTEGAKTVYKENDTIDTSAITATLTLANSVTADSQTQAIANDDLVFDTTAFDNTKLGEYAINVTYGTGDAAVSKTYNVTVESSADGVKGATVTLSKELNTQVENVDDKLTVKKGDITVAPVWTKDEVAGATITYVVKDAEGNIIDEATGKEFAIGNYTLTVEVTVTTTGTPATFTLTVDLEVTKKPAEGELTNVKMTVDDTIAAAVGTAATTEAKVLADGITLGLSNKSGSSAANINGTDYSKYVQIAGTFKASDKDTKSIKLDVKGAATIKVICKSSAADRILNLYDSTGVKVQDGTDSTAGVELSFTVSASGVYYLGSASSSINIYQIEIIYNA